MKQLLYNVATVFSLGGFVSTVVDGAINVRNRTPSLQIVILLSLSLCATLLRVPLLLSKDGTLRELYLFSGFMILEGLSLTLNLIAFDNRALGAIAAIVSVVALVAFVLLCRKTLQTIHIQRKAK